MTIEDALGVLQKEIQILRDRQAISEAAMNHLRQIASINTGFGWYDPATQLDSELSRKLAPHIEALKAELHF